jgi:hypothetical protein
VPPGPHINSAIDELATARVDENRMVMSSNAGASNSTLVPKDIQLARGATFPSKLPKAEHEAAQWQAAMEALILVAESGGPMFREFFLPRVICDRGSVDLHQRLLLPVRYRISGEPGRTRKPLFK